MCSFPESNFTAGVPNQNFSGFRAVGGPDGAFALHLFDHARGAICSRFSCSAAPARWGSQFADEGHALVVFSSAVFILPGLADSSSNFQSRAS